MVSKIRQNFHEECEAYINKQINVELSACYAYMELAAYFDRDDVALKNTSVFFRKLSHEERDHAEKFIDYQNKRGGRVKLNDIKGPVESNATTLMDAMTIALKHEMDVNASLLHLCSLADKHNDSQLGDFLEKEYLKEQVHTIKQLGNYISKLKRLGTGLGEYIFDKFTLKDKSL